MLRTLIKWITTEYFKMEAEPRQRIAAILIKIKNVIAGGKYVVKVGGTDSAGDNSVHYELPCSASKITEKGGQRASLRDATKVVASKNVASGLAIKEEKALKFAYKERALRTGGGSPARLARRVRVGKRRRSKH